MKNITLVLRVTPQRAIHILNRLYGSGDMRRDAWQDKVADMKKIIAEQNDEKTKKSDDLIRKSGTFYKKVKKTPRNNPGQRQLSNRVSNRKI